VNCCTTEGRGRGRPRSRARRAVPRRRGRTARSAGTSGPRGR
jgi:hypothetical protein